MPWLKDRKYCYIVMEGTTFGDVPLKAELKLEVWDSPNSAGVIIDAIRCLQIGLDRGLKGTLVAPSSYFMKSPPLQVHDDVARERVEAFIRGEDNETLVGNRGVQEGRQGARHRSEGEGRRHQVTQPRQLEAPHRRLEAPPPRIVEKAAVIGYRSTSAVLAFVPPALSRAVIGGASQLSLPRLAGEAPVLQHQLRPRAGPAAGRPAGPAAGPARLPRVRPLHGGAHAAPRRPHEELAAGIEGDGIDLIVDGWQASGRPMIVVAGHVGNNEAVAAAIASRGLPANVVADDSSFPEIFEILRQQRESWGVHVIPWRNLRELFTVLRATRSWPCWWTGATAATGSRCSCSAPGPRCPPGPARSPPRRGAIIAPLAIRRTPDGTFRDRGAERVHRAVVGPGRPPAGHPADRRRPRADVARRARAVVQLQADVADDPAEARELEARARRRCSAVADRPPAPSARRVAGRGRTAGGAP